MHSESGMTSFFYVASMTFDKRRNKIEKKRNMEIRDYRMRPGAADPRVKRVHTASRSTGGGGGEEKEE